MLVITYLPTKKLESLENNANWFYTLLSTHIDSPPDIMFVTLLFIYSVDDANLMKTLLDLYQEGLLLCQDFAGAEAEEVFLIMVENVWIKNNFFYVNATQIKNSPQKECW